MLVLSRKESEKVMLGDSIVLTIVRVSGDRVRLGIEAPSDMLILRKELQDNGVAGLPQSVELSVSVAPPAAA
jgi:carbon storage regulator